MQCCYYTERFPDVMIDVVEWRARIGAWNVARGCSSNNISPLVAQSQSKLERATADVYYSAATRCHYRYYHLSCW